MRRAVIIALLAACLGADSLAHPGGTNADGCHTNRRTGEYHCHDAKRRPAGRQTYCHVVNGERRCGYALRSCQSLQRQFGGTCEAE